MSTEFYAYFANIFQKNCGLRLRECMRLRIKNIDFESNGRVFFFGALFADNLFIYALRIYYLRWTPLRAKIRIGEIGCVPVFNSYQKERCSSKISFILFFIPQEKRFSFNIFSKGSLISSIEHTGFSLFSTTSKSWQASLFPSNFLRAINSLQQLKFCFSSNSSR